MSEKIENQNQKNETTSKSKKNNPKNGKNNVFRLPRQRVVKLTLPNILISIGILLASLILLNNVTQPSLGSEVTINEFLQNIDQDNYSEIAIRNDNNAVGFGKYVDYIPSQNFLNRNLSPEQIQNLPADFVGGSQLPDLENLNTDGVTINEDTDLAQKSLADLVAEFEQPASGQEFWQTLTTDFISNIQNIFNRQVISEIIVIDNSILVDWNGDNQDWIISATENDLKQAFTSAGLDINTTQTQVSYLRSAGRFTDSNQIEKGLEESRFTDIWIVDNSLYAKVDSNRIQQNYVNFGTATSDFTSFLQSEGVDLGASNFDVSVQPITQIDFVLIINILFIGLLAFLGFMLLRSMNGANGGLMRFGQSKARMFFGQRMNVTFDDVAGVEEAKEQLKEVVDFLKNPQKYQKLGAKIPRGALMVGQPGTGKTLLARAIAGEAKVPFFHTSGSEFEEMLVGAGASRVRDLFDKAKKAAPALIFIDEIDAVGRKRGTTVQSSSTEQTLNQILVEMDGFENRDNVIVIAATNRPDVLDPALLRPGRFDRKVVLDTPDIEGRKRILGIHAENKPLAESINLEDVAKRTVGFTGADLANMLNEAAIIVAKEGRKEITAADIEEAATKVQTGPVRRRKRSDRELRMTAYHEAAHALVMKFTPESDPVHRITILSRGMALGYTMPLPQSDELQMTRTKMKSKLAVLLAGYTAEEKIFGDVTTGASNDIEKATNIAKSMVKRFGMSKKLGLVNYSKQDDDNMGWAAPQSAYSDSTAEIIDQEVRQIIADAQKEAEQILIDHSDALDKLSDALLEKEVIEGSEFDSFFSDAELKQAKSLKSATQRATEKLAKDRPVKKGK